MGDVSKHFSRIEFACECGCGFDAVDVWLLAALEDTRDWFHEPVRITGPNRCYLHNGNTAGASRSSQHAIGKAADFVVHDVTADLVADYLERRYVSKYGIGRYDNRTHLDVRDKPARWDKR